MDQLEPQDEVLIVGDGPLPEDTKKLIPEHPQIRYWETEKTGYWGNHQRNEAIKEAQGDFVIFLDDDDWYLPEALPKIRTAVATNTGCVHSFVVQGHSGIAKSAVVAFPMVNISLGNGMVALPRAACKDYPTDKREHGGDSDSRTIREVITATGELPMHHFILTYAEGGIRGAG